MTQMKAGIIGYGYWGENLVRNFFNSKEFDLKSVADINPLRIKEINTIYPSIQTTANSEDLINDNSLEIIIIATPVKTHFELVKSVLINNKHVLVEKPMTPSFDEAKELVELAKTQNRYLIIDYTYLYSGAVRKLKEILFNNQFGTLQSIKSSRLGTGIIRDDVSVFGDLSSHDLAITNYILDQTPIAVKAEMTNMDNDSNKKKAVMTVYYPNNVKAEFESSWYSSIKERKMYFLSNENSVLFDDTLETNKIEVSDLSKSIYPHYESKESLSTLVSDLFNGIKNNQPFLSDGRFGLNVLKVLDAAQYSLENNGETIQLEPTESLLSI
jgi:predicted dehydrogenase